MKKNNKPMIIAVIALVLATIAVINSFGTGAITGHAIRTDIHYNDGYVGIGTGPDGPEQLLHVAGGDALFEDDVVIEDNLDVGDDLNVGGLGAFDNLSTVYLYVNGTAISGTPSGGVDHTGDVAVGGNLNVGGKVTAATLQADNLKTKVTGTTPTCNADNRGLFFVDNSTTPLKVKFCVGSTWYRVNLTAVSS